MGKKHNAVNYYVILEADAEGILRIGREGTETNLSDLLTNILGWKRFHKLLSFFNIFKMTLGKRSTIHQVCGTWLHRFGLLINGK